MCRTTITMTGAFLDAFQKVADMATGTRGTHTHTHRIDSRRRVLDLCRFIFVFVLMFTSLCFYFISLRTSLLWFL